MKKLIKLMAIMPIAATMSFGETTVDPEAFFRSIDSNYDLHIGGGYPLSGNEKTSINADDLSGFIAHLSSSDAVEAFQSAEGMKLADDGSRDLYIKLRKTSTTIRNIHIHPGAYIGGCLDLSAGITDAGMVAKGYGTSRYHRLVVHSGSEPVSSDRVASWLEQNFAYYVKRLKLEERFDYEKAETKIEDMIKKQKVLDEIDLTGSSLLKSSNATAVPGTTLSTVEEEAGNTTTADGDDAAGDIANITVESPQGDATATTTENAEADSVTPKKSLALKSTLLSVPEIKSREIEGFVKAERIGLPAPDSLSAFVGMYVEILNSMFGIRPSGSGSTYYMMGGYSPFLDDLSVSVNDGTYNVNEYINAAAEGSPNSWLSVDNSSSDIFNLGPNDLLVTGLDTMLVAQSLAQNNERFAENISNFYYSDFPGLPINNLYTLIWNQNIMPKSLNCKLLPLGHLAFAGNIILRSDVRYINGVDALVRHKKRSGRTITGLLGESDNFTLMSYLVNRAELSVGVSPRIYRSIFEGDELTLGRVPEESMVPADNDSTLMANIRIPHPMFLPSMNIVLRKGTLVLDGDGFVLNRGISYGRHATDARVIFNGKRTTPKSNREPSRPALTSIVPMRHRPMRRMPTGGIFPIYNLSAFGLGNQGRPHSDQIAASYGSGSSSSNLFNFPTSNSSASLFDGTEDYQPNLPNPDGGLNIVQTGNSGWYGNEDDDDDDVLPEYQEYL